MWWASKDIKQGKIVCQEGHSAFCVENEWDEYSQRDWLEGSRNILKKKKTDCMEEMLVDVSNGLSHFWRQTSKDLVISYGNKITLGIAKSSTEESHNLCFSLVPCSFGVFPNK